MKVLASLALVFMLFGCNSNSEPTPAATVYVTTPGIPESTVTNEPVTQSAVGDDEAFLGLLRSEVAWANSTPDADLIDLGMQACQVLEVIEPNTIDELSHAAAPALMQAGADAFDAGAIFGAAVLVYCPEWDFLFET